MSLCRPPAAARCSTLPLAIYCVPMLLRICTCTPAACTATMRRAVASVPAASHDVQPSAAATVSMLATMPAATQQKKIADMVHQQPSSALPMLWRLREAAQGMGSAPGAADYRALDRALAAAARPLCTSAAGLVIEQLRVGATAPPLHATLAAEARRAEPVRKDADEASFLFKFGQRRRVHVAYHAQAPTEL
ncbi:hypothetical protein EON67_12565, partial [archaeon]